MTYAQLFVWVLDPARVRAQLQAVHAALGLPALPAGATVADFRTDLQAHILAQPDMTVPVPAAVAAIVGPPAPPPPPPLALGITTANPLPNGTAGTAYTQAVTATGGTPPYTTWAVTAGTLPAGLALNAATGEISGTPTAAGPANFTLQVTDSAGATATQAFDLTVDAALIPLVVSTPSPLPDAMVGTPYNQTLAATGGTPPYTWTAAGLPGWLTLNAGGNLTGTPGVAGPVAFTVTVTDTAGTTATQGFDLVVNPVPVQWWRRMLPLLVGGAIVLALILGLGALALSQGDEGKTNEPPKSPSKLRVESTGTSSLRIRWDDNSGNETVFTMEDNLGRTRTADRNSEQLSWDQLEANTRYCFRMNASNAAGTSDWAEEACGTTAGLVRQPDGTQAPTDLCKNFEGIQTSVPTGLLVDANGNCVSPPDGKAPSPTPTPPVATPVQPSGTAGTPAGNPLEGIVKNATDSPTTDRNGICNDLAWISSQVGLQVVDTRSIGYVQPDGFTDTCVFDSTGNTAGTKTIRCENTELRCTLRNSSGEIRVYKGEANLIKNDVTSYTIRFIGNRYPVRSPFRNDCFLLTYERNYGSTRNPSYETLAGNFECPLATGFQPGNPLSVVAPSDRGDANCSTPQSGIHVCRASRTLTLTHPGGSLEVDVWPSYAEPLNCQGQIVENGVTKRIRCSSQATLFADHFTIRENGQTAITASAPSNPANPAPAVNPGPQTASAPPAVASTPSFDPKEFIRAQDRSKTTCTHDPNEEAWVCRGSTVEFSYPTDIAQLDVWSGLATPRGCQARMRGNDKVLTCTPNTKVNIDNFTVRKNPK